ncbi:MAG: ankyrin repeat domain-containing protein [Pyrinomonadaceae bacterium]
MSSNETRKINRLTKWGFVRSDTIPVEDSYPNPFGELTDLEFAAVHGRTGIIKVLIEAGADVNARSLIGLGSTPLRAATCSGQAEAVQLLIDYGTDLEAKDSLGKTCLFYAVEFGYRKVLQVLLDSGADVNVSDKWGQTLLSYAVLHNSIEFVKILLAASADVNATDTDGNTVLDYVRYKRSSIPFIGDFFTSERNKEMIQLLEEAKLKSGM